MSSHICALLLLTHSLTHLLSAYLEPRGAGNGRHLGVHHIPLPPALPPCLCPLRQQRGQVALVVFVHPRLIQRLTILGATTTQANKCTTTLMSLLSLLSLRVTWWEVLCKKSVNGNFQVLES